MALSRRKTKRDSINGWLVGWLVGWFYKMFKFVVLFKAKRSLFFQAYGFKYLIIIMIGVFSTITKGLLKGLEDLEVGERVETIQMTALLKTARILRRVLET